QAVALGPDCTQAWRYRALARLQAGDAGAAVEDLTRALEVAPSTNLWEQRASARYSARDFAGAAEDATKAIEEGAGFRAEIWRRRGLCRLMMQHYEAALADYDMALKLDPCHGLSWRNRGAAKLALGDKRGAELDTSEAIRLHPIADNFLQRGKIRLECTKYEEAIRDCTEALRMESKADAFCVRAVAKKHCQDLRGAVADLDEAIRCRDFHVKARELRAETKLGLGMLEETILDCDQAIPYMPDPSVLLCCRGNAYFRKGNYQSAAEDFKTVLQYDPSSQLAAKMLDKSTQSLKHLASWDLKMLRDRSAFDDVVITADLVKRST
ncbi:unnamed protein product, partial [Effrenium voratum]